MPGGRYRAKQLFAESKIFSADGYDSYKIPDYAPEVGLGETTIIPPERKTKSTCPFSLILIPSRPAYGQNISSVRC